jgi:hypothetical protein
MGGLLKRRGGEGGWLELGVVRRRMMERESGNGALRIGG